MFGLNKTLTYIRAERAVTDSGMADEAETTLATGVRCAIQPFVLNNLPPPSQRRFSVGSQYTEEFRCWIPTNTITFTPQDDDIVVDETDSTRFRVIAVIDDAGRNHHWLLRLVRYS